MTDQTVRLALPLLIAGQAQKEVTHNQALALLDALAHLRVLDRDLSAPPGDPSDGDAYLVGPAASGAWVGQSGTLAIWLASAWTYLAPPAGTAMWVDDEAKLFLRDGGSWREVALVDNLPRTEIASADPTAADDGYPVGQLWYNQARDVMWICRGNAAGAARWTYVNPIEVLGRQHTSMSKSDADTAEATLYTLTIPAGTMGPNDTLRVTALWAYPNSATTKSLKIKIGGSTIFSSSATTTASLVAQAQISNRGAVNSQIGRPTGQASFGTSASAPVTLAKDFALAQDITITAQWGTAGSGSNAIALESALVELLRV